jgi:hypothetical protein
MDELFRLYTAERQLMQKSQISINLVVKEEEEVMYSVLENLYGCNKSNLDCIINPNELGIDMEESINSRIASS